MITPSLQEYVKTKRLVGVPDEDIRKELVLNKWSEADLDEALGKTISPKEKEEYLGIVDLFCEAYFLFVRKFKSIFFISVLPYFLLSTLAVLAGILTATVSNLALKNAPYNTFVFIGTVIFYILIVVFGFITQYLGSIALLINLISNDDIGAIDSYKRSWKFAAGYFWVTMLIMFVTTGGLLLFIIPGIILGGTLIFSILVLLSDDLRGIKAMQASREYVRGFGWSIFLRFLLFGVFVGSVFLIIKVVLMFLGLETNKFLMFLQSIGGYLAMLYSQVFLVTMFKNIKSVKGGKVDVSEKSKTGYVVMAVIGLLSILVIPVFAIFVAIDPAKQIKKARDAQNKNNVLQIQNAVVLYFTETNKLPGDLKDLEPKYIEKVPFNPDSKLCYKVSINQSKNLVDVVDVEKVGESCDTKIDLN